MEELMFNLGKLFIGFTGSLGPVVFLMAALGTRDRRRSAISTTVFDALKSPELRGLYGVQITSRPFGRHAVIVSLCFCSKEQIREAMERLSDRLPPGVRFEVEGAPAPIATTGTRHHGYGRRVEDRAAEIGYCLNG
jgi:hypothetical protein